MVKTYTERWNNFQFRAPVYLDGHFNPNKFDLIKWEKCKPFEATDLYTGEKKVKTEYCFVIATLTLDEESFKFESCGLRYLEHRIDGLEQFVLDFCNEMLKTVNTDN